MRRFALLVVAATLPMLACGSTKEGDPCSTSGFLCADTSAALECQGGSSADGGVSAAVWVKLPCRGPLGCKREAEFVKCDMSLDVAGDRCASTAQGKGLCTSDGLGTLECRVGVLVKTLTCRTCTVSGDVVTCSP